MDRRAGGTGEHVIDPRLKMGDAMKPGRGRRRDSGAENDRGGKRDFCLAEHFRISRLSFATNPKLLAVAGQHTHRQCSS
jgi:hypothetical protein